MAVSKENQSELAICSSTPSFQESLDSQRELFQSQIGQLQNIVVTQCKLTGVNPLSQEMAAGALSINIGKRPRDLLNPKAVKYMQSVFSIKDAISKRESREISALFGVTVTQVREFFTSQRTRVRRFVRLSKEKATRSNACNEKQDELQTNPTNSDPMLPINPVPLDSVGPTSIEEGPSCCPPDESLPGMDELDKHFLDNIFSLMRKEESFSGQVKLMEWILQRKNSALLMWFLTKGGVMILATWLSQAAIEEQTSVLHVILKVLCHLPLHKALPAHMSAILQSVNKLRFYRASDISNRARILLSRWSKLFARTQAMKKPSAVKSSNDAQNEMLLKQSIGEIMEAESWDSKIGINEESLVSPYESSENFRKLESQQPLKLLPASTDDSNKKLIRGVSSSQTRERRKVLLVEQPGQRTGGRSVQVAKSVPANQGRPLSADDIQKAKMRAQFMQSKYGKPGTSSTEGYQMKTEGSNKSSSSQSSIWISPPKSPVRPNIEEHKKYLTSPLDNKTRDPEEPLWKKCKRVQIRWLTPPEVRINGDWSVGTGDNSKEVEVQKNRIRREKEIIYKTVLEISSDPKEPWDREMDYDDSLTPEIPIEQLPDADANVDAVETVVSSGQNESTVDIPATTSSSQNGEMSEMPEPDLELLAVLLKNPDLVFALTAGQSVGLSSEDTVKLLDMIKTNGVSAMGNNLNGGLGGKADEKKIEVSLPSPTPSSNPVTSGWRPEVAKNPFSRHIPAQEKLPLNSSVQPQISYSHSHSHSYSYSYSDSMVPQQPQTITMQMTHQTMPPFSMPHPATFLPEKPVPPVITSSPLYPTPPNIHTPTTEILAMKRFSAPSRNLPGIVMSRTPERASVAFSTPQLTVTRIQPQARPPPVPEPLLPTMHAWRARQGLSPNPHSQASQNNFNASFGGPQGGPVQPGPHWERDEYLGQPEFETWSPERNPIRSPEYMPRRNYVEPRMNMGHNYRPDRSRPQGFSGNRDQNRFDNRRWRERDRRR